MNRAVGSISGTTEEEAWKGLYLIGAIALLGVAVGAVLDIIVGTSVGGDLTAWPQTAEGRFVQIGQHPWLGLYGLDLLNFCTALLMIPGFLALAAAMRKAAPAVSALALALFAIGTAVFVANSAALPFLQLAREYAQAAEAQRALLACAGQALLAKGAHGSAGAFPGFALLALSDIAVSWAMFRSGIFSRTTGLVGLLGSLLLLGYLIGVTFIPGAGRTAMAIAAPGGLLTLSWLVMSAHTLLKL